MHDRFYEFGLSDEVLQAISAMGFEEPTQIQKIAIPPMMKGKDIIGVAQTGTGKTAAYGIPVIEKNVKGKPKKPGALVLVPTRELAMQVAQELNRIGANKGFVSVPIYGGQSIERQIKGLLKGADIVVGTPGRVIDLIERKSLLLAEVATVVLDEADEMLNMGFVEDMETILAETPPGRQTVLFSATMPEQIVSISRKYMSAPKRVSVDTKELVASKIEQIFYEVREGDRLKALTRILDVQDPVRTLVFCHTKRDVDELAGKLQETGYDAGAIHGDFTQSVREDTIARFKRGTIDILVATDVAARGLDISDVTHVINYGIPQNPEAYVHRIGRTGRAGKSGIAITLVSPREYRHIRMIEKTARTTIRKGTLPTKNEVRDARKRELTETLRGVIEGKKHMDFQPLVGEMLALFEPEDLVAAALSLVAGSLDVEHIEEVSGVRPAAFAETRRLFLTVGRIDKVSVGDIVKAIAKKSNVPGSAVGKVTLFDKYCFVEVPAERAEQIIRAIGDMVIGGRKVKVKADASGPTERGKAKPSQPRKRSY
jgi:ATP-dependent RNA helicase DeaD